MTMSMEAPSFSAPAPEQPLPTKFTPEDYRTVAGVADTLDVPGLARLAYLGRPAGRHDHQTPASSQEPFEEHRTTLEAMDPTSRGEALAEYLIWRDITSNSEASLTDAFDAIGAMARYYPERAKYNAAAEANQNHYEQARDQNPGSWTEAEVKQVQESAPEIPARPVVSDTQRALFMSVLRSASME